ncbi:interleukin-13 receptor subunit alpha-1-like isoform X1 [Stegostoma tigrinum]|uniref:interleukin-13 receptor subunit alpha-1-like isoform X1 n=1 Tax=Stegostoma tigrinum TaxID=3053191 RepID=UPI002870972B|nr:interleukin-13 receptor subunit alpha-1-like isoform X1 [Stegostoma tigrinum]
MDLRLVLCLMSASLVTEGSHDCTWTETVTPPTDLTVTLKGIGFINSTWTWKLPSYLENSTKEIKFESVFKYDGAEWDERKRKKDMTREDKVILNQGITFRVKALAINGDTCQESNWTEKYIPPAEGDANTAVRNFGCIFYNLEYINCTWDIGSKTPANTVYNFNYWQKGMDVIQNCTSYISKDGRLNVGCHLQRDQFDDEQDLHICVSGNSSSAKIKPFFYNLEAASFVQLSPPWGINISKMNKVFWINWSPAAHWNQKCVIYEIRRKSSMSSDWIVHELSSFKTSNPEMKIPDADPNVKNVVQVRARYNICGDDGIWSEWSEEEYFGEDIGPGWNWKIALLIIVPILVAAAAITLLTYLKQLQILILPPIPDPGKIFKGMFGDSSGNDVMWSKQTKESLIFKAEEEIVHQVTTVEQLQATFAEKEGDLGEAEKLEVEETAVIFVDEASLLDNNSVHFNLVTS